MTDAASESAPAAVTDWTQSLVYRDIVARPEVRSLIDAANAAGGKDNISVIVVDYVPD